MAQDFQRRASSFASAKVREVFANIAYCFAASVGQRRKRVTQ
jgi:hypothetical protein